MINSVDRRAELASGAYLHRVSYRPLRPSTSGRSTNPPPPAALRSGRTPYDSESHARFQKRVDHGDGTHSLLTALRESRRIDK